HVAHGAQMKTGAALELALAALALPLTSRWVAPAPPAVLVAGATVAHGLREVEALLGAASVQKREARRRTDEGKWASRRRRTERSGVRTACIACAAGRRFREVGARPLRAGLEACKTT